MEHIIRNRNFASTLVTPEQLIKIIQEDTELLLKSRNNLLKLVQLGNIETIEQLNDSIAFKKSVDGRA